MKPMGKIATVLLLVAALLVLTVAPSLAGGKGGGSWHGRSVWRGRTTIVVGAGPAFWWWYPYPYWYYPPPYYYYYPYPSQPAEPPVYIEQSGSSTQAPSAYWYYCPSASAYYPHVQSCPEAWIKVAPRTE